jgi:mono/diheme cytochrome c family protein
MRWFRAWHGIACCFVAAVVLAATASAAVGTAPAPKLVGTPSAGRKLFVAYCGTCHTFKPAGTHAATGALGAQDGPDLDGVVLPEATIIAEETQGGVVAIALMGKAAAPYKVPMLAYKGVLTTTQIDNIAAFEYASTHASSPAPKSKSG